VAAVADNEDQIAWERRQAKGAAIAALAAALFTFVGTVWRGLTLADLPRTSVADAIGLAAQPGPVGEAQSLRITTCEYYQDHAGSVIATLPMIISSTKGRKLTRRLTSRLSWVTLVSKSSVSFWRSRSTTSSSTASGYEAWTSVLPSAA